MTLSGRIDNVERALGLEIQALRKELTSQLQEKNETPFQEWMGKNMPHVDANTLAWDDRKQGWNAALDWAFVEIFAEKRYDKIKQGIEP